MAYKINSVRRRACFAVRMGMNEVTSRRSLGWVMLALFLLVSVALAPVLSAEACPAGRAGGGGDCVTSWQSLLSVETGWAPWLGSSAAFLVVAVFLDVYVPRLFRTSATR